MLSALSRAIIRMIFVLTGPWLSNPFLLATWSAIVLSGVPRNVTRNEFVNTSASHFGVNNNRNGGNANTHSSSHKPLNLRPRHLFMTIIHSKLRTVQRAKYTKTREKSFKGRARGLKGVKGKKGKSITRAFKPKERWLRFAYSLPYRPHQQWRHSRSYAFIDHFFWRRKNQKKKKKERNNLAVGVEGKQGNGGWGNWKSQTWRNSVYLPINGGIIFSAKTRKRKGESDKKR